MPLINELSTTFVGRKIVDYQDGKKHNPKIAWRVRGSNDLAEPPELGMALAGFMSFASENQVDALVIGSWAMAFMNEGDNPTGLLLEMKDDFQSLKHLFVGDILADEMRTVPIEQGDYGPILKALPLLETLRLRGVQDLAFKKARHDHLKSLTIESDAAGMKKSTIQDLCKARFPALEHLELWLSDFDTDVTAKDLTPILKGDLFPNLTYLGLCNSGITDEIAKVVADAPILEQLETLDLSKGTLSNEGAKVLIDSPLIRRLKKLDINHHYVTEKVLGEMKRAGIKVDGKLMKKKGNSRVRAQI